MGTPVHRLQAFINIAFVGHGAEHPDLLRLKGMMQGQVRMVPVTKYAQAFELFPLDVDELMGIGIALGPQVQRRHAVAVHAHGVQACVLNGHAVGIPAGNIRGIKAFGIFILNNDIFQNLVHSRTHMDMAIGIGRPVMEHPFCMPFVQLLFLFINLVFFPEFQEFRFPLRQVATHGKLCFR